MAEINAGTVLGPYRVIELIGSGGMARVYRAHHSALERDVAIKVLPAAYASDPAFLERFQQEARTVAHLRHPNILEVFDFGEYDGQPYIVMEFMAGGTLAGRLGQPMPLAEAIPIVSDVAAGLDHAHDHGVLHRDIKPGNVFFDGEGRAVVGDFGLAKIMEAAKSLTTAGTTLGTPEFMSPEQALGRTLDRRTDVYSLGAVVYMMLTGRVPYSGDTPLSTMFAHVQQPLPPPRSLNPALPESVEDVIIRSLAKEPADRFATTGGLAQSLKMAAGSLYSEPRSHPWQTVATAPPSSPAFGDRPVSRPPSQAPVEVSEEDDLPPAPSVPAGGRRPVPAWLVITGIIVLVVAAAILTFLAGRGVDQPTNRPAAVGARDLGNTVVYPLGALVPPRTAPNRPQLAAVATDVPALFRR